MELHGKLIDIQQRLKVAKDQTNEFGGFNFRSIEDIETAVKPLLSEHNLTLTFDDEPVSVGERIYIKATAILSDGNSEIKRSAYAREATTPKAKTDDAQLTGACSSYARKYAAGGLFLIDNTKDADSTSHQPARARTAAGNTQLATKKSLLYSKFIKAEMTDFEDQKLFINSLLGKETIDSAAEADRVLKALEKEPAGQKA
jgi:hypothetical protein